MKKYFMLSLLFLGVMAFAQQAGKAGELLKNEASRAEMQNNKIDILPSGDSGRNATGSNRNPGGLLPGNPGFRPPQPNFHQNFGYAEVFLRIPEGGNFAVQVGGQLISNSVGKFRFFDLSAGRTPVSIYRNGFLVYRTQINVRNRMRLVLDYFSNYGLYLLDTYPVANYGFNQWDDVWNNPYMGSHPGNGVSPVLDNASFASFMQALKKNSFDDGKLDFIKSQVARTSFSAQQIATILKSFSFDEKRLQAGKILYPICADAQNFFQVYNAFSFENYKRELMNFVANYR